MFKHILLPTDGSALSLRAVDAGIELASRLGARLYAFHVIAPFPSTTYFVEIVQVNEAMYMEAALNNAERYLAEVCRRASAAGVPCDSSHALGGHACSLIVDVAVRQQCDLIVMASHGWRGFDRLLLGSETHKVILNSNVPVLVCH